MSTAGVTPAALEGRKSVASSLSTADRKQMTKLFAAKRTKSTSQVMMDVEASEQSVRKKFAGWIKNVDFFGQTVNLTWNGEDRFKTTFGASVSIVLIAVLIAFAVFKAVDLF